jgi:hypothetical protein
MFLHSTKRSKGLSLRQFLYEYSPNGYNDKSSKNYFDFDERDREHYSSYGFNNIKSEETSLRKMRHRLLSSREVYNKNPEWSAIREDSEHEWAFMYVLNSLNDELLDTYKRIGNLHNETYTAMRKYKDKIRTGPKDEDFYYILEDAYGKFLSKLKKIKYVHFLNLQKGILSHIHENKSHYGMNIYRFEKQMRLYNITSEINCLRECKDEKEEAKFLKKSVILNALHFPKLYQDFSIVDDLAYTAFCADTFYSFRKVIVCSSLIIIDRLIENEWFGDWKTLLLDTINEMTESVFCDPNEIDYNIAPESPEYFEKIISAPVRVMFY